MKIARGFVAIKRGPPAGLFGKRPASGLAGPDLTLELGKTIHSMLTNFRVFARNDHDARSIRYAFLGPARSEGRPPDPGRTQTFRAPEPNFPELRSQFRADPEPGFPLGRLEGGFFGYGILGFCKFWVFGAGWMDGD